MRLFRAELRRIAARRLVRVTLALTLVGVVGAGAVAFVRSSSLSESTYRQRVRSVEQQRQVAEQGIKACLREHGITPKGGDVPNAVARACFPRERLTAKDPRFHRTRLRGILQGVTGMLAIVGWALGASLIGAEFASRGLTTQLTWETRRWRLYVTKGIAVLGGAAVLGATTLLLVTATMLPAMWTHGAPSAGEPTWATLFGVIGRGTLLTVLGAGIGYAIATIGRNTAAALGAGFAYVIVLENILGSSIAGWRRWLLLGNVIVLVSGHDGPDADIPGRSLAGAAIFLTVVAVTLLAAAGTSFKARDVA